MQPSNPCTLCGAAVIPLEKFATGIAIGTVDLSRPKPNIPLTVEQHDVQMVENNLSGQVPYALDGNKFLLMKEECGFKNYLNKPPVLVENPRPSFYADAGPQGDQVLLRPRQRREMMEFDAKQLKGYKYVKHAISDRVHTKKIMNGPQFHRGILGVDSNDNETSEIYGAHAKEVSQNIAAHADRVSQRRERIAVQTSSIIRNGNLIVPESMPDNVKVSGMFQSKGSHNSLNFADTRNNLFPKTQAMSAHGELRAQHLRDEDIAGRSYNFITHTAITQWPSKVPVRTDHRMLHPSQNSLEGTRNVHGSIRPY